MLKSGVLIQIVKFVLTFFYPLSVDQCKFMDSKMRPLYLVFENMDELGDLVRIIFKNGDGECRVYSYAHLACSTIF